MSKLLEIGKSHPNSSGQAASNGRLHLHFSCTATVQRLRRADRGGNRAVCICIFRVHVVTICHSRLAVENQYVPEFLLIMSKFSIFGGQKS
jgi:hypothetical protein